MTTKPKSPPTTRHKALEINRDGHFYGSFAEIGAGQEVARHFFQAGLASNTVAKSMSAYDKSFSDIIYGKGSRFVSEERLLHMLRHEYNLVEERLPERKANTSFFAFANTVATSSHEEVPSCHGWMGLRFQTRPGGATNDIIIHVRMLDRLRLQQQDALGVLGVNLIYTAYKHLAHGGPEFVSSLLDNLTKDRIEVNFIRVSGPDTAHLDNRLLSLELVQNDMTRAVLFSPQGETLSMADTLYKKPVMIQRGTFRPITLTSEKIIEKGLSQAKTDLQISTQDLLVVMELSLSSLSDDKKDFLDRVDTLNALGHHVMVSNFSLYAQLHTELRRFTDNFIFMVIGANTLQGLLDSKFYVKYHGGLLAAFGHMMDDNTRIYVFPFKTESGSITAHSFAPPQKVAHLYRHLLDNGHVVDMRNCEDVDSSLHSEMIRKLLAAGDPKWQDLVPASTRELIKNRRLFGYKA